VTKLVPLPPPPELTRLPRKVVTQEVPGVSAAAPAAEAPAATLAVLGEVQAERGLYELAWQSGLLTGLAIARMEVSALFLTPIVYAVGALVVLLTSIYGYLPQVNTNAPVSTSGIFSLLTLMAVFYVPLCTMRLAAQQRSGTLEHLLTSPIRFWELVAGRWLGGVAFFAATISFSLIYVVLISADQKAHTPGSILGFHLSLPSVDYGSIFTGYFGLLLLGAAWVAVGLLIASLTQNRIIAAGAGILTLVALQYGFGVVSGLMTPPFSDLFDYLGAANRARSFFEGQVALNDVVYFVTVTLGALFITTRIVESRKWR
jgi:ABC-2 type transport system permease protein